MAVSLQGRGQVYRYKLAACCAFIELVGKVYVPDSHAEMHELKRRIAGSLGQKQGEKAGKEGNAIKQASQFILSHVRLTGQICIDPKCTLTCRPPESESK